MKANPRQRLYPRLKKRSQKGVTYPRENRQRVYRIRWKSEKDSNLPNRKIADTRNQKNTYEK